MEAELNPGNDNHRLPPPPPPDNKFMDQLRALLEGGGAKRSVVEPELPDYVKMWKQSLGEASKIMDLYGKWEKPPLAKPDFARMIFSDLLERKRRSEQNKA